MRKISDIFSRTRRRSASDKPQTADLSMPPPPAENPANTPPSEIIFDPLDPAFVQDPYPTFCTLREHEPIHRSPMGSWVLTRYQDVFNALADDRLGNAPPPYAVLNERNRHRYVCADVANNIIPFKDSPEHAEPRKLISRAFHQHIKQNPPDIKGIAERLLNAHRSAGEIDIVRDFSTPLSVSVLCQVLGIPEQDVPLLKGWSEWFFYLFSIIPSEEVRRQLDTAMLEFREFFAHLIEDRKSVPRDDLISALLTASAGQQGLSDIELIDNCMLLFADGANADAGISNASAALLQHPEQLQLLRENPELMPMAVEECLRYESPAQFLGRIALEDMSLGGVAIRKHASVLLMFGSANRDPAKFDNPDQLDITRRPNAYLSFGRGQHACVGRPLVKLEIEVALTALLQDLPDLKMKENRLHWMPRLGHRWLSELPVTFTPY